ncbi:hypothetical protein [Methylophaga sp.]
MTQARLTEAQQAERKERFRYVDLNHPLMQILFHIEIETDQSQESEP